MLDSTDDFVEALHGAKVTLPLVWVQQTLPFLVELALVLFRILFGRAFHVAVRPEVMEFQIHYVVVEKDDAADGEALVRDFP